MSSSFKQQRLQSTIQSSIQSSLESLLTKHRSLLINSLPLDCLLIIFGNFPLQEKLALLRAVCHHWKASIEVTICTRKRSLIIKLVNSTRWDLDRRECRTLQFDNLETKHVRRLSDHDHCVVIERRYFLMETCDQLQALFPSVDQLVIHYQLSDSHVKVLNYLIQKWPCLTNLSLWIKRKIVSSTTLPSICENINSCLTSLKRLDIFAPGIGPLYHTHPSLNLSTILPQLEQFSLSDCTTDNFIELLGSLKCSLKRLTLHAVQFYRLSNVSTNQPATIRLSPAMTRNVTQIQLISVLNRRIVSLVCEHFRALRSLSISFGCTFNEKAKLDSEWLVDFAKLKYLTELKLYEFCLDSTTRLSIPSIRKLTFSTLGFFHRFVLENQDSESFNGGQFCSTLKSQYPNLEQLNISSLEPDAKLADQVKFQLKYFDSVKLKLNLNPLEYQRFVKEISARQKRNQTLNFCMFYGN